jgi:hypothetical protein
MISEIAGASGTAKQKIILAENRSCAFYQFATAVFMVCS